MKIYLISEVCDDEDACVIAFYSNLEAAKLAIRKIIIADSQHYTNNTYLTLIEGELDGAVDYDSEMFYDAQDLPEVEQ